jgi:hypothetical protein
MKTYVVLEVIIDGTIGEKGLEELEHYVKQAGYIETGEADSELAPVSNVRRIGVTTQ